MVRNALHHTEKSFMLLDVVWKQYYHSSVCTFLNFKNEGSHESEKYFNWKNKLNIIDKFFKEK